MLSSRSAMLFILTTGCDRVAVAAVVRGGVCGVVAGAESAAVAWVVGVESSAYELLSGEGVVVCVDAWCRAPWLHADGVSL